MKSFLFSDNDFGTLALLFGQSCFLCHIDFVVNPIFWSAIIKFV